MIKWFRRLTDTKPNREMRFISAPSSGRRSFAAADTDRLLATFQGTTLSINEELVRGLAKMRARSRQLANDNDYAKRFLAMVKANVVGPNGIALQAKPRRPDGTIDRFDAQTIETAFKSWGRPENCTMSGRLSWNDVQRLVIESWARDGEVLIQLVKTASNPYGLALHIIEADYLDEQLNQAASTTTPEIRMGIELDSYGRATAYYIRTGHPGENTVTLGAKRYERVPADQIIHLFLTERPGQVRGTPAMHTAIRRLNMLGGYEEAELVAARTAASKMGFFTSPDGEGYIGSDTDANGNLITDAEPGLFEQLPAGMSFQTFDPQHPTSAFSDFVRAALRGAASGLGVSYHSLSNDLENVNFSSIRSGVLEEREHWKVLQTWFAEQLCERVYQAWITSAILTGAVALPPDNLQKFKNVVWQPRGWAWVDPLKDAQANAQAVELGVLTRADIAAATGRDLDDMLEQLAREKARMDELGLTGEINEE